jgi:hypothetical protein
MRSKQVIAALRWDKWNIAECSTDDGIALLRYRTPVPQSNEVKGYGRVLRIVWPYADEGTGAMPSHEESEAMGEFENRLCEALEFDAHAYLAAVLTFDGARQWVFYTGNVEICGSRLEAMPQNEEPYPIELDAFDDPAWSYLRTTLLGPVISDD